MSVSAAIKPSESSQISPGETSRASRGKSKLVKTPSSSCVLPILESQAEESRMVTVDPNDRLDVLDHDKTFLTGMNDFIPEDILNSLTQRPVLSSREQLGPPSKHKKLKPLEVGRDRILFRSVVKKIRDRLACACDANVKS